MDFSELVRTRRTVNNYKPDSVPRDWVEDALSLSLWAPNHRLTFPWVYTWVGPRARAGLADLNVEMKSRKGGMTEVKAKAIRDNIMNTAHLISLGIRRAEAHQEYEDYATLSCSVQIISMDLWRRGVGTKWSTGGAWMNARTYEILGLDPGAVRLEGVLMIGIPAIVPAAPARPPLAQFLRATE